MAVKLNVFAASAFFSSLGVGVLTLSVPQFPSGLSNVVVWLIGTIFTSKAINDTRLFFSTSFGKSKIKFNGIRNWFKGELDLALCWNNVFPNLGKFIRKFRDVGHGNENFGVVISWVAGNGVSREFV